MYKVEEKFIVIVDAYSTASKLPNHLKLNGFRVIHVQSSLEIPDIYKKSFNERDFEKNLVYSGDLSIIINKLSDISLIGVIAGAESGTILADKLAEKLSLPGNPSATSQLRRNKYLMGEAIRSKGLDAVIQSQVSSAEEACLVAKDWGLWPLIIKPLDSAGSDGVFICHNEDDLIKACNELLHKKNRLDLSNKEILLQERMFGQQYIVNSISFSQDHFITEIWKDNRIEVPEAGLIYDYEHLIDQSDPAWFVLEQYAKAVLKALDVGYGPCHIEIMMTKNGPKLIELGARMQGGISSEAVVEAIGESHLTLTSHLLCNKDALKKYISSSYVIKKKVMAIAFISNSHGKLIKDNLDITVGKLDSFFTLLSRPNVDDIITKTIDLFTSPGVVYLVSDSQDKLLCDYRRIREWEKNSALFDLVK